MFSYQEEKIVSIPEETTEAVEKAEEKAPEPNVVERVETENVTEGESIVQIILF